MIKPSNSADNLIAQIILGIEEVKGLEVKLLDLRKIENTKNHFRQKDWIILSGF
jgi:ribosome-associated protein